GLVAPDPIPPDVLADLMVASAIASTVDVVRMRSYAETCVVLLAAGGRSLGRLEVPADVGLAAAARLALFAGIAPAIPSASEEGRVARIEARVGAQTGELMVSMAATSRGIDVEIHPLLPNGRTSGGRVSLKRCTRCGLYQPPQRTDCDHDGMSLAEV